MSKHQHKETADESVTENATEHIEQSQPQTEENNATELQELKAKNAELNDKYLRLYSEFDNFRKRTAKEKIELIQSGGEDVFKSFLPVIDDFERAIKSNAETTDINTINEGINLIFNKFKNTLQQKGLTEMKAVGEPFDTDLHEAITNIPAPSEDMKGKVIDELEKGYLLNGKVIRFAKVVIGN
jgi:molecular chaperone GrpE